ncbi:MAG: hypothetical protein JNL90_16175 [Planctomycetes bacterium]|nr:hypothetical protein [Planctomycetota bacterium]
MDASRQFRSAAWCAAIASSIGAWVGGAPVALAQHGTPPMRLERDLSDPDGFRAHLERQTGVRIDPRRGQGNGGGAPRLHGERPTILLTGYWPPSNEAIREFSDDPVQNPGGWIGQDWEGRGYDVHSYFPEFVPRNCRSCGRGSGDLEVDYQDTSADFAAIVADLEPIAVITFSRGFDDLSWELEMNQYNRTVWIDDFASPFQPTPAPPDAGWPADGLRLSTLPVQEIVDAVDAAGLGLDPYICYSGNGGGYLSEFIAYHGVWYQDLFRSPADPDWCIAGGHVHVGGRISWANAKAAAQVTLREVITWVDQVRGSVVCQPDLGFGGPGLATLACCGEELAGGATADLQLSGAPAGSLAFLLAGLVNQPTPFAGGMLLPMPPLLLEPFVVDADGKVKLHDLEGGCGPQTLFAQFACLDPAQPGGFALSNALQIELLP